MKDFDTMREIDTLPRRRWLRDPANGYLGGICAVIADRLRLPAFLVRIVALAALVLWTWPVLIAYAAAWFFMDSRDELPRLRPRA
jgi:phage shock protein PspC (stress-responsive transcriptional regulator)